MTYYDYDDGDDDGGGGGSGTRLFGYISHQHTSYEPIDVRLRTQAMSIISDLFNRFYALNFLTTFQMWQQ